MSPNCWLMQSEKALCCCPQGPSAEGAAAMGASAAGAGAASVEPRGPNMESTACRRAKAAAAAAAASETASEAAAAQGSLIKGRGGESSRRRPSYMRQGKERKGENEEGRELEWRCGWFEGRGAQRRLTLWPTALPTPRAMPAREGGAPGFRGCLSQEGNSRRGKGEKRGKSTRGGGGGGQLALH